MRLKLGLLLLWLSSAEAFAACTVPGAGDCLQFNNGTAAVVQAPLAISGGALTLASPIYAVSYGVIADGVTDNTTALQNAVTACANVNALNHNTGGQLILPSGSIVLSGGITASAACKIEGMGSGGGFSAPDTGATVIQQNSTSSDTFTFTTLNGVTLRDFAIVYGNGSTGTGKAIHILPAASPGSNPNRGSHVENVRVWGGNYAIYCDTCSEFAFLHNRLRDWSIAGIYVPHNSSDPDDGDSSIIGNVIWDFNVTTGDSGIRLDPAAAVHIVANKILGGSYGIRLTVSQGPTGTLLISDNSIEQFTVRGVSIEQSVTGKTFAFINIHDNQLQSGQSTTQSGIAVVNGSSNYINMMDIHDNIFNLYSSSFGTTTCVNVGDGNQVHIHHNVCDLASMTGSIGYSTFGNITNVLFTDNIAFLYGSSKYNFSVTTGLIDHFGLTQANLPGNTANGSQIFVTDGTPGSSPCTGSSTGSMAFRQNGAWKCF